VSARQTRLTAEGSVFGTPAYLPPEVIQGDLPDRRADVYALATVAFELMSGRAPFEAENPLKLLPLKVMNDAPTMSAVSQTKFPDSIEAVIARGLTRDPQYRWPSAGEFISALDAAVLEIEVATGLVEPVSRTAAMRRSAIAQRAVNRTGTLGTPDPGQAQSAPFEQMIADAEQLRVRGSAPGEPDEKDPLEASLPPMPDTVDIDTGSTSRIEHGAHTLSVEFRASTASPAGVYRRRWLWFGVGAGMLLASGVLAMLALQGPEPQPTTHTSSEAPVATVRPAPPPAPTPPEPAAPELDPEPAAEAPAAMQPRAPKPETARKPREAKPRAERAAVAETKPRDSAKAVAPAKPSAPMLSAGELVQAAARELIQGHLSAAADLYAQATRLDPKSEPAYRGLGLTYERLGRKADAIRALNKALALSPNGQNAAMLKARLERLQASQ
jgi:hypothetical protein